MAEKQTKQENNAMKGRDRKRRSSSERRCLSRSSKILFAGRPSSLLRLIGALEQSLKGRGRDLAQLTDEIADEFSSKKSQAAAAIRNQILNQQA